MKTEVMSDRGFRALRHPVYPADSLKDADDRIVSESSAIGDYIDSMDRPGSSYLWFGPAHHLNREEVSEVIAYLSRWLATGRLQEADALAAPTP